jgi:hypothetical protein
MAGIVSSGKVSRRSPQSCRLDAAMRSRRSRGIQDQAPTVVATNELTGDGRLVKKKGG